MLTIVNFYCVIWSDEEIQATITIYNGLCGFEAQCTVATNEFNAVSTCDYALQSNDIGALCSASCRSLLEGCSKFLSNCKWW